MKPNLTRISIGSKTNTKLEPILHCQTFPSSDHLNSHIALNYPWELETGWFELIGDKAVYGSIVSSARRNNGEGSELVEEATSFGRLDAKTIFKNGRLQGAVGASTEAVCPTRT